MKLQSTVQVHKQNNLIGGEAISELQALAQVIFTRISHKNIVMLQIKRVEPT